MSYIIALSFGPIMAMVALTTIDCTSTQAISYRHLPMSILGFHDINGNLMVLGKGEHGLDANGANGGTANGLSGANSPGFNGTNSVGVNGNNTNGANG